MNNKILFEYGYIPWYETVEPNGKFTKGIILYSNGRLCKIKHPINQKIGNIKLHYCSVDENKKEEDLIFQSVEVAQKVAEILDLYKDRISNLPNYVDNIHVLDGLKEFLRFGDVIVSGDNLFAEFPYVIDKEYFNELSDKEKENEIALEIINKIYKEVQIAIGEIPFFKKYNKTSEWERLNVSKENFMSFLKEKNHFIDWKILNMDYAKQNDILILEIHSTEMEYSIRIRFETIIDFDIPPFKQRNNHSADNFNTLYIGYDEHASIKYFNSYIPENWKSYDENCLFSVLCKEISVTSNQSDFW